MDKSTDVLNDLKSQSYRAITNILMMAANNTLGLPNNMAESDQESR